MRDAMWMCRRGDMGAPSVGKRVALRTMSFSATHKQGRVKGFFKTRNFGSGWLRLLRVDREGVL
jgi:hypothetical protein